MGLVVPAEVRPRGRDEVSPVEGVRLAVRAGSKARRAYKEGRAGLPRELPQERRKFRMALIVERHGGFRPDQQLGALGGGYGQGFPAQG